MIHHLSYPRGDSVNDGISHEHSSVQYANVDKAIKLITQTGVGSYLAKTDIKSAFGTHKSPRLSSFGHQMEWTILF